MSGKSWQVAAEILAAAAVPPLAQHKEPWWAIVHGELSRWGLSQMQKHEVIALIWQTGETHEPAEHRESGAFV